MYPIRLNGHGAFALLQEDDVGHNICSGIGTESVVGQTDRSQQFSAFSQILAYLRRLLIHGIAGGHKGDHTTRTHLVKRLGKEIVMNRKTELVVSPVIYLIVTERHVAYSQIEEVPAICGFKACHGDISLGIQLLGNAA